MGARFDKIYKDIVDTIAEKGIWSEGNVRTKYADGTAAHYKSYIGYQFRLDNSDNVDVLDKLGCKFWDEWKMQDGTIGKAYGYQIAQETFGQKSQLHYVINELKKNPNSRRIMTEIWVPKELSEMALTPCVHLTQWSVIGNKLYLEVRQRSCDVALGLVANVFQYSVLHKLVALECGLEPAEIIWNIHNVHIYDRHYDKLIKQVNGETFESAKIKINNFKSIFDFKPDDIEILDYKYGEKVSYEVAI